MSRLQVLLPDAAPVTHELTDELITLGRVVDNVVQIEDASVSSHHAELVQHDGDYLVRDIGSTNGTRLNGKVLPPNEDAHLKHGDQLIFGSIPVVYLTLDATDQQPLPAESTPEVSIGSTSVAPADFTNASPFSTKKAKKDPASILVLLIGILALLAAGGAIALILQMQPPM